MEPTTLAHPQSGAPRALEPAPQPETNAPAPGGESGPLDLSRLEPPRRLAEARLEEVTIDGICGVY